MSCIISYCLIAVHLYLKLRREWIQLLISQFTSRLNLWYHIFAYNIYIKICDITNYLTSQFVRSHITSRFNSWYHKLPHISICDITNYLTFQFVISHITSRFNSWYHKLPHVSVCDITNSSRITRDLTKSYDLTKKNVTKTWAFCVHVSFSWVLLTKNSRLCH